MADLQLETVLTANAAPLNAALQSGSQGVKAYAQAAQESTRAEGAAMRQGAAGLEAYRRAQQATRAEVNQLTQAYRQLPAQITDVTTSLASGMPVWLVAIQQGGQIRDSFGGTVPMFRELASAINPVRVGMFGLATGAAAVALAYNQGSAEADAYRRAIVLNGNAAGATVGQLQEQAAAIGANVATQAQAAEVLAQLAASGNVAAGNMRQLAEAALRLERVGGPAAKETASAFAELGRDPLKAAVKLNESTNFLTESVYRQIKALAEQGRTAEAAAVAQQAYAETVTQRAKELEGNLGTLESAWMKLGEAAKGAWDRMLNIGRKETPEQQVAALQRGIESLTEEMGLEGLSQARFNELDKARQALIEQQSVLQSDIRLQRQAAQAAAGRAEAVKALIATEKEREAAAKAAQDAYEKFRNAMLQRLAVSAEELRLGRELTAQEREELEVRKLLEAALEKSAAGTRSNAQAYAEAAIAQARMVAEQREAARAQEALASAQRQAGIDAYREAESIDQGNQAMRQQIDALGKTRVEVAALEAARLGHVIAMKEETLAEREHVGQYDAQTDAIRQQIARLREHQALLGTLAGRQEEEAYLQTLRRREEMERRQDEQRRDGIAESISEGVAMGTLSAKRLWDIFRTELARQFARTVLMPQIRPAVDGADSWIKTLIGAAGAWFAGGADFGSVPADSSLSATGDLIRGRRAGGGQVEPWGRYWVGERGPELLQMGAMGGSVLPNHASGWGGNQVVQNITYNVPDGYTPAMFASALDQNNQALKGEIASDMARPGRLMNRAARMSRF